MSRRSWALWGAATLTALAPGLHDLIRLLLSGDDGSRYYSYMSFGQCTGDRIHTLIQGLPIWELPIFDFGGAPLLVLALVGWYAGVRTGRHRLGRLLARCVVALLLLSRLPGPLLLLLDGAYGPGCMDAWGPPEMVSAQVGWGLYFLVPPILVLLAVRAPRRAFVRRGRLARTTATILTVAATLLAAAQAAPAGKVSTDGELDCAGFGDGTATWLTEAEKRFLCEVRGYSTFRAEGGIEGWQDASDQVVVTQGHHLCRLATRHGGDLGAPAVRDAPHGSLADALDPLCPAVVRWREREGARQQAEAAAYQAAKEKACARHRTHRAKIRPVRQRRATMWTEFWTLLGWEKGFEGNVPDLVGELVGSGRGALAIWAADESGHACVFPDVRSGRSPARARRRSG
ncbi:MULTISPECIES: hypothetical protein [unclassified Nonomuraea]|uniref:hypothetical protein n=1 Tax=unclassified Nonomuraea TaxID=2593643 RepID=UPI0033E8AD05